MRIQPEVRAAANSAVATYTALTPILKRLMAEGNEDALSLAYLLHEGKSPRKFTEDDELSLINFMGDVSKVYDTYLRHFGRGIRSQMIIEMALR